jgi:hypothetical protein
VIALTDSAGAATIPDVADNGKIIQAFYDPARKCYWVENSRGGWIEINEANLRRRLRGFGLRVKAQEGERLSQVDQKLIEIQNEQDIVYAGPLAGHQSGLLESGGDRILVRTSPKLIEPVKGEWPILKTLLSNLLADDRYDQLPYLFGWLKIALEALETGIWRPGQALVLARPRDCGKSLLQRLITLLLGGPVGETVSLHERRHAV